MAEENSPLKSLPNWIGAISLLLIAVLLVCVLSICIGSHVVVAYLDHAKKQRMLQREPWREFLPPEERFR